MTGVEPSCGLVDRVHDDQTSCGRLAGDHRFAKCLGEEQTPNSLPLMVGVDGQAGEQCHADRSARRSWSEQVPAIADDVEEHGDLSVRLLPGLGDELDAGGAHPLRGGVEVLDA